MKTVKQFKYVFLFVLAVATASCSKDDDGGGGGAASKGTIAAKVDGNGFASNSQFTVANKIDAGGTTTLTVQGSDNSGKAIVLIISGFDGTGTYNIGGGANVFTNAGYTEANAGGGKSWQAPFDDTVAGEINVSEVSDTNIKGTFNFTAKNSEDGSMKEISDGSFNVDFQ